MHVGVNTSWSRQREESWHEMILWGGGGGAQGRSTLSQRAICD